MKNPTHISAGTAINLSVIVRSCLASGLHPTATDSLTQERYVTRSDLLRVIRIFPKLTTPILDVLKIMLTPAHHISLGADACGPCSTRLASTRTT